MLYFILLGKFYFFSQTTAVEQLDRHLPNNIVQSQLSRANENAIVYYTLFI